MTINPIGIQSYQQLTREATGRPAERNSAAPETTVTIEPQGTAQASRLAVKASAGTYADHLSPEEKAALEMVFSRFREAGRFGPAYRAEQEKPDGEPGLGQIIDVKV